VKPHQRDALRYPAKRVLLQRTRLAYVHLQNLLTDAKRDRSARVYGYVAVWLPEELITLYMEEGEVVNATTTDDATAFEPIAISDAVSRVPNSAEYGSVCFHEASDEQMDLMFATQTGTPLAWPRELATNDADALLAYLYATMHDGAVEVQAAGAVHYVVVASGKPVRGYFSDRPAGDIVPHFHAVLDALSSAGPPLVRLWPRVDALPAQAAPAMIQSYRDLVHGLEARLAELGFGGDTGSVEKARRKLARTYPMLERFSPALPEVRDPVTDAEHLTSAMGAWVGEALVAVVPAGLDPADVIREVTGPRHHLFQAAGFYEALPWKMEW